MKTKPIIGILAEVEEGELANRVSGSYIRAVEQAGGVPILLPYVMQDDVLEHFVELADGFLFTGGVDVEPRRYGEETKATCGAIQYHRDELELGIFSKVFAAQKPIMAICRGIQLVNVALGGTLYQDVPTEVQTTVLHRQTQPKTQPSHAVNVTQNTPLYTLVGGKTRIAANSFHHQAIKALGEGLAVMATADDGMIEAVFGTGDRYLRAYQWHPERLIDIDGDNRLLFDDFIKACRH
jgi:putative glutamine amidotransferase